MGNSFETRCFDKSNPIYLGANLTIHNDIEHIHWDNMRCSLWVSSYGALGDNIVCDEAWEKKK